MRMNLRPITEVARDLDIDEANLIPYGRDKAKVELAELDKPQRGKLVLVSAMTPTKAGEGKTTTSIGLTMGLNQIGEKAVVCLREPSLGPVFGIKGGGTGGGAAQIEPAAEINLHFTGDLHAITSANNLLAALVDNDLHFGAKSGLDSRRVTWRRVLDMNDRALRQINIGLGGRNGGLPRESAFDITAASEVMAILGLATSEENLRERLGRIVVGRTAKNEPITADDLGAAAAMSVLLKDALKPNIAQTREGTPAIVHGGPFANIAHGCSSILGTKLGLSHADIVVTEAGFGFDLGGEKFFDIKCREAGIWPNAVTLVATVRALKLHGDGDLEAGIANLEHHLDSVASFGVPIVVGINLFPDDTADEIEMIKKRCAAKGVKAVASAAFAEGGAGATELAEAVRDALSDDVEPKYLYDLDMSYKKKLTRVAKAIYGAASVNIEPAARKVLRRLEKDGINLPICVAKTPLSISDNPKLIGRPSGFAITVREARLSAGAGFVVCLLGDVMTMPGLPREPSAKNVRVENGRIYGLMQND